MKKIIHIGSTILAWTIVLIGFSLDILPMTSMSGQGKILFYGLPMIILFADMVYQIKKAQTKQRKESIKKKMLWMIFGIYLLAIITLLFFQNEYRYIGRWSNLNPLFSKENLEISVNFIPFKTILDFIQRWLQGMLNSKAVLINIIGNLIAFAPFGFFVPLLLQNKIKNIKSFILFMIGIVFLAEALQFFLRVGQADIDDVILNVIGAVIVYSMMKTKKVTHLISKLLG